MKIRGEILSISNISRYRLLIRQIGVVALVFELYSDEIQSNGLFNFCTFDRPTFLT